MGRAYLKPEPAKRSISLSEENEKDREWFKDKLSQCNRQIESDLADAYKGNFPTDENSDNYKGFADAALAWLQYQRAIFQSDKDGEESALRQYERIIDGLKTVAKSIPTYNANQILFKTKGNTNKL
jgi:hypothetical protein